MTEDEIVAWLLQWFAAQETAPDPGIGPPTDSDYFEAGFIDSFGVIELIGAIESHFHIRFAERDFQDRRFSTIDGLAEIIVELVSAQGVTS